jgi:hypothetical protein
VQHAFDRAIAARARKLGLVFAVKVGHIPSSKNTLVELTTLSTSTPLARRLDIRLSHLSSSPSRPSASKC